MATSHMQNPSPVTNETALAIIGMSGRFPGAASLDEFWQNLVGGVKAIRQFSRAELLAAGVAPELLAQENYVRVGSPLDGVEYFDAAFFGYTPREAEVMDPQHRLFLECAWEALEDAAYDARRFAGLIGMFAGSGFGSYLFNNIYPHPDLIECVGRLRVELANERDALATTVSYKLDLKGPALSTQTFCSTSLVALHLACQSLLSFECDMALAGGVAIDFPQSRGYLYEEGGILSADGECRTFDAAATGSIMGNGVGVVALKRLTDAIDDGDHVYAVILGSAMNNDGALRVSYTAPGLNGQKEVIAEALGNAQVGAESIQYIETHGTGTRLGDAVELAAMIKAFEAETHKTQFCAIGSVKPNIGHLDRASGITGLIKTVLALQHKQIPPSLNFERTSSDIDLARSPFYVNTTLADWDRQAGVSRRAGVSSFGIGGTNVHVILEEAPVLESTSSPRSHQLLLLSAKSASALEHASRRLGTYLESHEDTSLADVAYTLSVGRTIFNHRRFVVAERSTDAASLFLNPGADSANTGYQIRQDRPIAFSCSGLNTPLPSWLRDLRTYEPVFEDALQRCCVLLRCFSCWHALEILCGESLNDTMRVPTPYQPQDSDTTLRVVRFVLGYALAELFKHWGIVPRALFGSPCEEYLMAELSGVFSLDTALQLLLGRPLSQDALHTPGIPYISPLTGTWATDEQVTDPRYWEQPRLREECDYNECTSRLDEPKDWILLEAGFKQSAMLAQDDGPTLLSIRESSYVGLLKLLGQLWTMGATIHWSDFYSDEHRCRLSLPTYPFERQRYWIDAPREASSPRPSDRPGASPQKLGPDEWFYLPTWQKTPLPSDTGPTALGASAILIFANRDGLSDRLIATLASRACKVVVIYKGERFARLDDDHYILQGGVREEYGTLCAALSARGVLPELVLHCWSVTPNNLEAPDFYACQDQGFYSLLFLARALAKYVQVPNVHIGVVSNGAYQVGEREQLWPEKATLVAACKVITQEYTHIVCQSIDVQLPVSNEELLVDAILQECASRDRLVAYRDEARWTQTYGLRRLDLPSGEVRPPLRQRGVYMITGGFGRVGRVLARYLARVQQARLVLIGRTGLPAREDWATWLRVHDEADKKSEDIRYVQALEVMGAEVLAVQADVADQAQMQQVVRMTHEVFGQLHGVIHAAGVATDAALSTIDTLDSAVCEEQFAPKVHGLLTLEHVLRDEELDFCLVFSSLSAVLGGLGLAAYAAANLFMDTYIQKRNLTAKVPWTCVNWDTWQVGVENHGPAGATVTPYSMQPHEGVDAFLRVLASGHRHIVNSVGDLQMRIRQWIMLETVSSDVPEMRMSDATGASTAAYENKLLHIWQETLGVEQIGLYDNFFELGGNSLIGLQVIARMRKLFHMQIPIVALFEAPTISAMASYLRAIPNEPAAWHREVRHAVEGREQQKVLHAQEQEGIALIGMSGRFPGAATIEQFWQNLREGVESITVFSDEELLAAGVSPEMLSSPDYVRARPILADVEHFDASFFGYSPREAELMDPQHRLFLECAWESLEHAGYDPGRYDGSIGVFAGANVSSYLHSIISRPDIVETLSDAVNGYQVAIGTDKDALTTTVSYKLDLKGPSLAVQTFCSTSLVAVHMACQSLLLGESDIVLAGGVSVRVPVKQGHQYNPGGMESPDGHCRAFDADASGCSFGDGVGVVVLKRLTQALEDGDTIYAVVKGSAVNNDGSLKVSYSAPSVVGQSEVVTTALARAGVDAGSISYVEAHGTATELGDPIEFSALTRAFRAHTERTTYCALGSVKTNVGHLDRAAGVTSLIKVVQALHHAEIPASLHFRRPNQAIDFEQSPFYVNTERISWPDTATPRRAAINSLGMGGTNAHVIVEEAPPQVVSGLSRPWQLLVLSARSEHALSVMSENLAQHLRMHPELALSDVAYTLQIGRKRFEHRRVLLCQDRAEVLRLLEQDTPHHLDAHADRSLALLFPGVGELRAGVTSELYAQEETFRFWVDRCCELLQPELGVDLRELLFAAAISSHHATHATTETHVPLSHTSVWLSGTTERAESEDDPLQQTRLAQPATFVIEYALAQLLMQWGMQPRVMLGYSLGEYVAACLAGVFSLQNALKFIARRASLIQESPAGAMLAVPLPAHEITHYLRDQVEIAAITGPTTCILAGPRPSLLALERQFEQQGVASMRVKAEHAFHTTLLEPLRQPLTALMHDIPLHAPTIPYLSNVTGTWITKQQATDPDYWASHMCRPVQIMQDMQLLLQEGAHILLEVGSGQSLSTCARQHPDCKDEQQIFSALPAPYERQGEVPYLLSTLGKLWQHGVNIDWRGFYRSEQRRRVPLPTYPFERQRYWLPPTDARYQASTNRQEERRLALNDWFYSSSWRQSPLVSSIERLQHCWLLFVDDCGVGALLKEKLSGLDQQVILVSTGAATGQKFAGEREGSYTIDPSVRTDYVSLLKDLRRKGVLPTHIVHLWSVDDSMSVESSARPLLERGFYSLLYLAQAMDDLGMDECQLTIVSTGVQDITGDECIQAEKATLIGPCKVIPQEYPNIHCRSIDITLPMHGRVFATGMIDQLVRELLSESSEMIVALRGRHRWVQRFESINIRSAPGQSPLRENGVYLITGGMGGIGMALATYLATTIQPCLVLTSRSDFPGKYAPEQIEKVRNLEALGARVLVVRADVCDEERMQDVVRRTLSRFGTLHGVFHLAGVPATGLMQLKSAQAAAAVLAPKVQGVRALEHALQSIDLDFLVLFSSLSAITGGGPGQVDYCAANAFLDAYAHASPAVRGRVVSIDWGEWQWNAWDAGLEGYPQEARQYFQQHRQSYGIDFEQGCEALLRILHSGLQHVVVSTEDFPAMVEGSKTFSIATILREVAEVRQSSAASLSVPDTNVVRTTPYAPPLGEMEQELVRLWSDLLGIKQIGVHDNFFEVGGHSLMGTQLIARLRKRFHIDIRLVTLFEAPTIAELAIAIELILIEQIEGLTNV